MEATHAGIAAVEASVSLFAAAHTHALHYAARSSGSARVCVSRRHTEGAEALCAYLRPLKSFMLSERPRSSEMRNCHVAGSALLSSAMPTM